MDEIKIVKEICEDLFKQLEIKADINAEKTEDTINIAIDCEDNALLIGKHGNTLSSLEVIISLMLAKKLGEFRRIIIEIGGYRKEREEYLQQLVSRLRENVMESGVEKSVRGLKPWERRFVHLYFKEDSDVFTESEGEGNDRTLIIKKK